MSVQEFNEQLAALTAKKEALQSQADAAQAELARQLAAQQEAQSEHDKNQY